jgi:N-acetylmuramic acid 6-phosphate etherase
MAGHIHLSDLQTEARNPQSSRIDTATTTELCRILNDEDASVSTAVKTQIPIIAQVIEVLTERVRRGGRVFYIGAGTSGR